MLFGRGETRIGKNKGGMVSRVKDFRFDFRLVLSSLGRATVFDMLCRLGTGGEPMDRGRRRGRGSSKMERRDKL